MAKKSNPNGANQFLLDPRQNMCWALYIDPNSESFGNGTQSAIKAGYEPDYADQITTVEWFKGKIRRLNLLDKAEKVLDMTLDMKTLDKSGFHKDKLLRIKQDSAKFLAERLGKGDGYSTRNELTGANGERLEINVVKYETDDTPQIPT